MGKRLCFSFLRAAIFLPLLLLGTVATYGQQTVTGHITDATSGEGIANVTVTVSGTTQATITDEDGNFSIQAVPDATLVFTSVSHVAQTVPLDGRTSINVAMERSTGKLSEVVIIGYGTVQQKDLTGSVTKISADDFQSGQVSSPAQLIAGKVAGVQIVSNGGAPGAGSTIRIRGGASLNASNDPLIVIDGIPIDNGNSIAGVANPLSMINPNDIESFTVLKDASATAIYGSRASNGVIIITTKEGRIGGKPKFNFNTTYSVASAQNTANVIKADNFREIVMEHGLPSHIALLGAANTDWQNVIYHNAITTDNNLSVSGGFKNLPYRISLGYLNQEGILKTGKLKRYTAGLNLTPRLLDDHLKIDINLKGSLSKSRFANEGAIGAAVYFDPTKPVYSDNAAYNGYWEWTDPSTATGLQPLSPRNPLGLLMDYHNNGEAKRFLGNALLDYKVHFLPDLHLFVNVGIDKSIGTGTVFVDANAAQAYKRSPDAEHSGVDNQYKQESEDRLLEAYFNYTKQVSSIDTRFELVGGYAYQDFLTTKYNFADKTVDGYVMPGSEPINDFDEFQYTLLSYYGRVNISIKDRYILTGTVRTDGSSRFAEDERWGVFPSGAIAWNIANEQFLKNSMTVSALKLRLGYGITGQQSGIGLYDYKSFYNLSGNSSLYQLGEEFYHMYAPSGRYPGRTWEQTATSNIGLDFGFANGRISGSIDVYYKETTDLLNEINQPAGSNFSNKIVANVGTMENRGIEVSLNLQPVKTNRIVWDLSLNGTYNENEITQLIEGGFNFAGNQYYGITGGTGNRILINSVGYNRGSFYVYKQVYDEIGMPIEGLFADLNRDGIINEKDLYQYQSGDPQYFFGASTNLNIDRKWNLGFVMRASIGNYVYNNNISASSQLRNILNPLGYLTNAIAYNLVAGEGDRFFLSDYYVQNGSFLKMDNAYVSYTFDRVFGNRTNLTLSANAQNVFTVTNYFGVDPEVQSGVDNNIYPRPFVMSFGANLNF